MKKYSLTTTIYDIIIRCIPIENYQYLAKFFTFVPYIANYILIIIIIMLNILGKPTNFPSSDIATYCLFGARMLMSILYILFQHSIFYLLNRFTIIQLLINMTKTQNNWYLMASCLILQILMSSVWVLRRQVRFNQTNTDGRLELLPLWWKQILLSLLLLSCQFQAIFSKYFLLLILSFRVYLSIKQMMFCKRFKIAIYCLQCSNILIVVVGNLATPQNIDKIIYTILVVGSIYLLAVFYCYMFQTNYKTLYEYDDKMVEHTPQQMNEKQTIEYFYDLLEITYTKNTNEMRTFIYYHRNHCLNVICPLQYRQVTKQQHLRTKITDEQAIRMFAFFTERQMLKFQKRTKKFAKLQVLSLISTNSKAKNLDSQQFLYRRQLYRIKDNIQVRSENYEQVITLCEKKTQEAKDILKICISKIYYFFSNLQKEKLNCNSLITIHAEIRKYQQQLLALQKYNKYLNSLVRVQINWIFQMFFQQQKQLLPTQSDHSFIINMPTGSQMLFLICAEVQNKDFCKIQNVTKSALRMLYYPKAEFLNKNIEDFIPTDIQTIHNDMMYFKYSKKAQFVGKNNFSGNVFVQNALGYMVAVKPIVYRLNSLSGRKWVASLEPVYQSQAVITVKSDGKILGINEMAVQYGFTSNLFGSQFTTNMTNKFFSQKGCIKINPLQQLFKDPKSRLNKLSIVCAQILETVYHYMQYSFIKLYPPYQLDRYVSSQEQSITSFQFLRDSNKIIDKFSILVENQDTSILNLPSNIFLSKRKISQKKSNYSEDIVPVAIMPDGKIDHIKNRDVRNFNNEDFEKKPYKLSALQSKLISKQFYQQHLQTKIETSTRKSIILKICMIVLAVIVVSAFFTGVYFGFCQLFFGSMSAETILAYKQKFNYAVTSVLPLGIKSNININIPEKMQRYLQAIEQTWKQVYNGKENNQGMLEIFVEKNQMIQNTDFRMLLADFQIAYMRYLNNQTEANADKLIQLWLGGLNPGFNILNQKITDKFTQSEFQRVMCIIFILGFTVFLTLLMGLTICAFLLKKTNKKTNILSITSKIKDTTIQSQINKALAFSKMLTNNTIFIEQPGKKHDQNGYNSEQTKFRATTNPIDIYTMFRYKNANSNLSFIQINDEQQNQWYLAKYDKKINYKPNFRYKIGFITLLTFVIVCSILAQIYLGYIDIEIIKSQVEFENSLYKMSTSSISVWASFNQDNNEKIVRQQKFSFINYSQQMSYAALSQLAHTNSQQSQEITNILDEDLCKFLSKSIPNDKNQQYQYQKQGTHLILADLFRKYYDLYIKKDKVFTNFQKNAKTWSQIAIANIDYIPIITDRLSSLFNQFFYERRINGFIIMMILTGVFLLLILLGTCAFINWIKTQNSQTNELEKLLFLFPFDEMMQISSYRKLVKENIGN